MHCQFKDNMPVAFALEQFSHTQEEHLQSVEWENKDSLFVRKRVIIKRAGANELFNTVKSTASL